MIDLRHGDMLAVLPTLDADSIDACVTDPPYGLEFMGKEWDAPWKYGFNAYGMKDTKGRRSGPSFSSSRNPMCKVCHRHKRGGSARKVCVCEVPDFDELDHRLSDVRGFQDWSETWAREVLRVLKPGGHLLAMGGTRTFHRLVCAIEDAGFEVRDTIAWVYGSGFPKSLDISKAIDRAAGAEREVVGSYPVTREFKGRDYVGEVSHATSVDITAPATTAARQWDGWGTALKPAMELVCVARKPLSERTVAANVLRHGTGGINVDACRVEGTPEATRFNPAKHNHDGYRMTATGAECAVAASPLGRWPANLAHDASPEVEAAFKAFGERTSGNRSGEYANGTFASGMVTRELEGSTGSASRFFYSAKATAGDRADSRHPTIKPVDLIRWLVRMVTPPGGTVLDPFAGSGTTGEAAMLEGFNAILIEREAEHAADIEHRQRRWHGGDLPLFAEPAS